MEEGHKYFSVAHKDTVYKWIWKVVIRHSPSIEAQQLVDLDLRFFNLSVGSTVNPEFS
jgi:hypothetical protein